MDLENNRKIMVFENCFSKPTYSTVGFLLIFFSEYASMGHRNFKTRNDLKGGTQPFFSSKQEMVSQKVFSPFINKRKLKGGLRL